MTYQEEHLAESSKVDPREEKLPVWVQDKLRYLRRIASDSVNATNEFKNEHGDTPVWIQDYSNGPKTLPDDTHVVFRMLDTSEITVHRNEYGHLSIHHNGPGGTMVVRPQASNVIIVASIGASIY